MPDNVVHLPVEHASPEGSSSQADLSLVDTQKASAKADAYLDNINSPKPSTEQLEAAMKQRLQDVLLPIQEGHRHEFVMGQLGVMDACLNAAVNHWNHPSIAEGDVEEFQASLSYVLLCLIVPGDMAYTKSMLKFAQANSKVGGAKAIYRDDEAGIEKYRKARQLLAAASISLNQASNCYLDQRHSEED